MDNLKKQEIRDLLNLLTDRQKLVLIYNRILGYTREEIARHFKIPVNQVKKDMDAINKAALHDDQIAALQELFAESLK